MKYAYPALLVPENDYYLVQFPDLPNCFTDGDDIADALVQGEDVLGLILWGMEKHGQDIPAPSKAEDIKVPEGAILTYIATDTEPVRRMNETRAVRKNISIPAWLDHFVTKNNISLSNFLQNALIREYGLQA